MGLTGTEGVFPSLSPLTRVSLIYRAKQTAVGQQSGGIPPPVCVCVANMYARTTAVLLEGGHTRSLASSGIGVPLGHGGLSAVVGVCILFTCGHVHVHVHGCDCVSHIHVCA